MTSRDFCFWLQGFLELAPEVGQLDAEQTKCIQRHLALVFKHEIDPGFGDAAKQKLLSSVHAKPVDPNAVMRC
jgi:hypothetical protein